MHYTVRIMLQLTDKAVSKVQDLMAREEKAGFALRVAVRGGGCSGFSYALSYEEGPGDNDSVLEFGALKVIVDAMSGLYLDDVTIDYLDGLNESGFQFKNPKATGTCGCGSSFSM